ncbi:MAG: ATP-binding protein [Oscillospiraceae bacterium]|nr:ATP-binding protein [Oscillospiraceae bacterium]
METTTTGIRNNRLLRNTFFAQTWAYAAASFTSVLGTLVDGIIIGQFLGIDSVSAFGIASPLMVTFAVAGAVISVGARTRYVRLIAGGQRREAQSVFSLACLLSLLLAAGMMVLVFLFATPLTRLLGAAGNAAALLPKARAYILGIAAGLPARNLVWTLWVFMPVDNDRGRLMIASAATTASNIILDLLVVFVLRGDTLEMGLATSLSHLVTLLILLLHFRRKDILLRFSLRDLPWRETGGILRQGLPSGLYRVGNTLRSAVLNHALALVASSAAIAAYSVQRQADSFFNILFLGMADTLAVLAGMLMSEGDSPSLRRVSSLALRSSVILSAGLLAAGWFLAPQFCMLFIRGNPEALRISVRAVRCYLLSLPLYGINHLYLNYCQGIGMSRLCSCASVASSVVFPILSMWAMLPRFGADAVWLSFPATQILMLVFFAAVILVKNRKKGIRGDVWRHILLLTDDIDVPEEDRMDRSIASMAEVDDLSRAVWRFCEAHGCDERRRYLLSLSVEEMAGNVIEHGFAKDRRRHSVDVLILKQGEDYILRIRDDCAAFDPVKRLALHADDDPARHIGLRMVVSTAKEVDYIFILKLNNLLVKL